MAMPAFHRSPMLNRADIHLRLYPVAVWITARAAGALLSGAGRVAAVAEARRARQAPRRSARTLRGPAGQRRNVRVMSGELALIVGNQQGYRAGADAHR